MPLISEHARLLFQIGNRAIIAAMRLIPLRQWICDTCGEVIESPRDGWLEWVATDSRHARDFRIVHHRPVSPRGEHPPDGCYQHASERGRQDSHLDSFVGADGLARLLSFLDIGYIDPDDSGPRVESTRELAELTRRHMLPHYEEARLYWSEAVSDGFFDGANEVSPYTQTTLTAIIERFAPRDPE